MDAVVVAAYDDSDLALPGVPPESMAEGSELGETLFRKGCGIDVRSDQDRVVIDQAPALVIIAPDPSTRGEGRRPAEQAAQGGEALFRLSLLGDGLLLAIHAGDEDRHLKRAGWRPGSQG